MAEVAAAPSAARYSLRGDPAMLAAGCAAFGVACPAALRATNAGGRAALRLGPDEILLLSPPGAEPPAAGLAVDVGARQVGFAIAGRGAEAMLAAGCPLDLVAMGVNHCTRTLLGKAEIVLWRTYPFAWRVEVWRSFAAYARALLEQAGRDWP